MTELHTDNLGRRLGECQESFDRATAANDWPAAERVLRELFRWTNHVVGEARAARIEADALATELQLYRPTRADLPPAPLLPGYCYVFTAKFPWVCAAVERREVVYIAPGVGGGYYQTHYAPEKKTLCGKATTYPVSERFTSGGWPRLHELCPECTKRLVIVGVLKADQCGDGGVENGDARADGVG